MEDNWWKQEQSKSNYLRSTRALLQDEIESHNRRRLNPSTGNYTFLVILVQFTDHENRVLPPVEYYDELCNGVGTSAINPAGSISEYFTKNSYGKFNVKCDVRDWRRTDNTEAFYAQNKRGLIGTLEGQEFFKPVLSAIDAEADQFEWFELDGLLDETSTDRNQYIELVVLHSGYAAEALETDCAGQGRNDRIWSQGHKGFDGGWATSDGNFQVWGYTVASALNHVDNCQGGIGAKMGIITHEMFHSFGGLDLYDPNVMSIPGGVGAFDIMASPYGQGNDLAYPGLTSPFTKIEANWLVPEEITQDGVYEIEASIDSDKVYIIKKNYPSGEYLLIENRQVGNWDDKLWGNGGLVIYHIDESANKQEDQGFPGQSGWPQNGNHYQVAVVQADGRFDMERGIDNGDSGDFFVQGRSLSPGDGFTYPNTDSYQGGRITNTGIIITDISASGQTMSFRVDGLTADGQVPTPTPPTTPSQPTPTPPTGPTQPSALSLEPTATQPTESRTPTGTDDDSSATGRSLWTLCTLCFVGGVLLLGA